MNPNNIPAILAATEGHTPEPHRARLERRLGKEQCNILTEDQDAIRWALEELDRLQAELAATGEQARGLRKALEAMPEKIYHMLLAEVISSKHDPRSVIGDWALNAACSLRDTLRYQEAELPKPTAAERQARENARKAKALEGVAQHCADLRIALADALVYVFDAIPPKPHDGPCGPEAGCDAACSDFASAASEYRRLFNVKNVSPDHYERQARENAEKARLLDQITTLVTTGEISNEMLAREVTRRVLAQGGAA